MSRFRYIAMAIGMAAGPALADEAAWPAAIRWSFVAEAGLTFTPSLDVSGANQGTATRGFHATTPDARLEIWRSDPDSWSFGAVVMPIDARYTGTLSNDVTVDGRQFHAGQHARFDYQFPNLRLTANYPVWSDDTAHLRLGVSLIARYTQVRLSSGATRVTQSNTLALPLLNVDAGARLDDRWSLVARGDLLPAESGTGLYDVFAGVRYAVDDRRALEFGSRTFYGGYTPDKPNSLNIRIWQQSVVARLVF